MSAEVDDAPVVRYIQKILLDAISAAVSYTHLTLPTSDLV